MRYRAARSFVFAGTLFSVLGVNAGPVRGQDLSAADYARAEQFMNGHAEKLTAGTAVTPRWLEGDRFWYRNRKFDGFEFMLVDPTGRELRALSVDALGKLVCGGLSVPVTAVS